MTETIIGLDWGSSGLSAQLIAPDGTIVESFSKPAGMARPDRSEIPVMVRAVSDRWPSASAIYLSGMIGSAAGWQPIPYRHCPTDIGHVAARVVHASIDGISCVLVPGLICFGPEGRADVMRGEEIEVLGLIAARTGSDQNVIALPGTHTKWAWTSGNRITGFLTAMTGELFDLFQAHSLIAPFLSKAATPGNAFERGVCEGFNGGAGLARQLFGVCPRALHRQLDDVEASSYLRGILTGAEIADVDVRHPELREQDVSLIGNTALCALYHAALAKLGYRSRIEDKARVTASGYLALHKARCGPAMSMWQRGSPSHRSLG